MRLIRRDGDQNLTKFSMTLPPGLLASLAGVGRCSDAQIAQAASRTGPHGGAEGLASPSCPASSVIGHTQTGAGVAGPFDVGTILVAALHGIVDVEAVARIDSKHGGIRATFTELPDAPIAKVVVNMQGAKKGLIVNSTGLCAGEHRANAQFEGHNGRRSSLKPVVGASGCGKKHRKRHVTHERKR